MKIKNYRWIVVALLFTATLINYMDRQIIGLLKPTLEKEFNWTETDFSRIVIAFTAAYALGLLFFGRFIDKVGTRIGYSVSVVVWSVAGMLHALASSAVGFGIARFGLGVGEAGNFPAAMKAVAEWFPKKERAIATGIFNAGTSVGVVAALFVVPWILARYGWHEVFWITGAVGFVWLLFWLFFYQIPAKQNKLTEKELAYINQDENPAIDDAPRQNIKWVKLFSMPQTWAFVAGKFFIDPIYWFFLFWLPSYFSSVFHLDLSKPSIHLMVIYASTTLGSIGGGFFSSWLIRKGYAAVKARRLSLLIFAVLEMSIILSQFANDIWMAVILISLAVAVHQAWATNMFTLAADMFPKETLSSVTGIGGMAGAIGGILFPILVGYLLDLYKQQGDLAAGYKILFIGCGFTYLVTWLIIYVLTKKSTTGHSSSKIVS
ncbi:MFS transporter [Pedobacter sp.]